MRRNRRFTFIVFTVCAFALTASAAWTADPLPSWNDTAPKKAVIAFVERVTTPGSPEFVPMAERIATFDNDGTLWAEQPLPFQLFFTLDRVKALAPQHPEWKNKEPFASLLKGDVVKALSGGEKAVYEVLMYTHAGMTTDEFEGIVTSWIATAKHPKTGKLYTEMVYQPMLELLAYLQASGFKTFIVSGGGAEFMRPWTERVYGIPPEQVIGSTVKEEFATRDGKPVGIKQHIGRRPIASFGNTDGDLQMMQWTAAGKGASLCVYIHHTDANREWAYDRKSLAGKLDRGLDEAQARGWTVVDMKNDWNNVFAFENAKGGIQ